MWFSLEQCGLLLRDAVNLYEGGSDATAVGLAMLAREEMGKARILRDLWRDLVNNDRQVDGDEVRKKLGDHENKQRKAQIGQALRFEHGTQGAALLHTYHHASTMAEREAAWETLEDLIKPARKRMPVDRHKARMRALYVDLDEAGTGWSRPADMRDDARAHLEDVANDYAAMWERFQHNLDILAHGEPNLAAAVARWTERPALLAPARPQFPPRARGSVRLYTLLLVAFAGAVGTALMRALR